jgi:transketolase
MPDEEIRIGGSRVVRVSEADTVTIVACGVTVGEAERASDILSDEGIRARVIDCYSIKPIDGDRLRAAARDTRAVITVEDHWPEGGLGDAVLEALADEPATVTVRKLAVRDMPTSGTPEELLAAAEIDAAAIVKAAMSIGA